MVINVLQNYKSNVALKEMYENNKESLKGKQKMPGYKHKNDVKEIVLTKYAVRTENNKIMLSLSKELKNNFCVKSLKF